MTDLFAREGSTRSAGLLRIAVVLLLWARFAEGLMFAATPSPGLSIAFFASTTCMLIGVAVMMKLITAKDVTPASTAVTKAG